MPCYSRDSKESSPKTQLKFINFLVLSFLYGPVLNHTWLLEKKTQFSWITQSGPTLWAPIDCSTTGFAVHHQLAELTQTHFHRVSDAIQPSHPLLSLSPQVFNLSQHQGISQWVKFSASVGQSTGDSASASVLPMNTQGWFPLGWIGLISLQSKGIPRVFSNTTVQKHQFFGT